MEEQKRRAFQWVNIAEQMHLPRRTQRDRDIPASGMKLVSRNISLTWIQQNNQDNVWLFEEEAPGSQKRIDHTSSLATSSNPVLSQVFKVSLRTHTKARYKAGHVTTASDWLTITRCFARVFRAALLFLTGTLPARGFRKPQRIAFRTTAELIYPTAKDKNTSVCQSFERSILGF